MPRGLQHYVESAATIGMKVVQDDDAVYEIR